MSIQEFAERVQREHLEAQQEMIEWTKSASACEALAAQEHHKKAVAEREAAELMKRQYKNCMRPSLTLKAEIEHHIEVGGEFWTATYGDCVGHGPTPETACQDFDHIWTGKNDE